MDSKKRTSLDDLLNQVRQGTPVMEEKEAMNFIRETGSLPLSKSRVKIKPIIMTSIVLTLGLIGGIWMMPAEESDAIGTNQPITKNEIKTATIPEQAKAKSTQRMAEPVQEFQKLNEPIYFKPQIEANLEEKPSLLTPLDTPKLDSVVIIIEDEIIDGENPGDTIKEQIETQVFEYSGLKEKVSCQAAPEGLLKLDPIALQKIGIVGDKGLVLFQRNKTEKGNIEIQLENQNLHRLNTTITGLSVFWNDKIVPLAIAACDGNLLYAPNRYEEDFNQQVQSSVALYVPAEKDDAYYIFWFEISKDLLNELPEDEVLKIKDDGLYHVALPEALEREKPMAYGAMNPKKLESWLGDGELIHNTEAMEKLGIELNGDGFEIHRKGVKMSQKKNLNSSTVIMGLKPFDEEKQWSLEDIEDQVPFYITTDSFYLNGQNLILTPRVTLKSLEPQDELLYDRYRLVGFKFDIPDLGPRIFWYPYSPAIQSILTKEENKLMEQRLAKVDPSVRYGYIRPEYENIQNLLLEESPTAESLNAFEPSPEIMEKMGITILPNGSIQVKHLYEPNALLLDEFSKERTMVFEFKKDVQLDSAEAYHLKVCHDNLVYITDDLGLATKMIREQEEEYSMNELIPVLIRSGQPYSLYDKIHRYYRPDIILWYRPTAAFLELIESEGQFALLDEVESFEIEDSVYKKEDCRFTEICRNKAGVFNNHSIYPNPASGYSNFMWTAQESSSYSITLYALNGQKVRSFENQKAVIGKNTYQMDISNLPPGVYMVILRSEKGDEIHERLVVKE